MNPLNPQLDVDTSTFDEISDAHEEHNANQASRIEGRSWLKNPHPLGEHEDMNWRLFANLAGDGHIKGTPLEGYYLKESLGYFQRAIDSVLTEEEEGNENFAFVSSHRKELEIFVEDLNAAAEIAERIKRLIKEGDSLSAQERAKLIQDYAEELSQQFKEKKMGWVPCGWLSKNGESHAMTAFVNAKKGTLTIVNAGAGLNHHPSITETKKDPLTGEIKEETKCQEFITISGFDKKRLLDKDLFIFLLELQVRPMWDGMLDFDDENIYHPLINYLKGKVEAAKSPFDHPDLFKKPQRSGTCAAKAVSTSLYYTLCHAFKGSLKNEKEGVNCYKKIKYFLQTQALVSIVNKLDASLTESQDFLLHDVMDNLARSAEKLYEKHLLADEDLADLQATLLDIRETLATLNIKKEGVEDDAEEPSLTADAGKLLEDAIQADTSDLIQSERRASFSKADTKSRFEIFVEKLLSNTQVDVPLDSFDGEELKEAIAGFRSQFSDLVDVVKRKKGPFEVFGDDVVFLNQQQKNTLRKICEGQFARFITALPRSSREENSNWNHIDEHQIAPLMEEIYQLMSDYKLITSYLSEKKDNSKVYSSKVYSSNVYSPDSTVLLFSLFATNAQLAYRLPETKLEGFKVACDDLFFQIKSPYFVMANPKIQERLDDVLKYFIPDFKLESLNEVMSIEELKSTCKESLFSFKNFTKHHAWGRYFSTPSMEIDKESIKSDPTFLYVNQFLKEINNDSELQNKFYRKNVLPEDSQGEQLGVLMAEPWDSDSMLPASVHALLRSSLLCTIHVYSEVNWLVLQNKGALTFTIGGAPRRSVRRARRADSTDLFLELTNFDHIRKDVFDERLLNHPKRWNEENQLVEDLSKRVGQNDLIPRQGIFQNQSLETSRDIEMMGGDPYEEFARTTAFINNHVLLLKEKEIQDVIKMHLFRPLRLLSQLHDEPAMLRFFSEAVGNAINHYRQLEDWETCLFLAKLGNDVKVFAKDYESDTMMQDFRTVILDEIFPRCKHNGPDRVKCYQTLASFYENIDAQTFQNDPELLNRLAEDVIGLKILSSIYGNQGNSVEDLPRLMAHVNNHLSTLNSIDPIMNNVLRAVCSNENEYRWEGRCPVYECEKYRIDIRKGEIVDKEGGLLTRIPERIFEDEAFKKIFKGAIETCENIPETNIYVINKGLEDELIVKETGPDNPLEFQRNINGKRFNYLNTPGILSGNIPTIFSESVHCWVHDGDHPEIIGFQEGGDPVVNVKLEKMWNNDYRITHIYPYTRGTVTVDESKSWIPFIRAPKLVKSLSRIEYDASYIECWKVDPENHHDESGLQGVKLPRFGLSFNVKEVEGKKYLFCEQFPGYFLIESSQPKGLEKVDRFIAIQNMAGEQKILLPKVPLKVSFAASPFDRKIEQQIAFDKNASWLEFSVKNGGLSSRNIESQLYLAYLFGARGDVDKALNMFKEMTPLDRIADDPESGNAALSIIRMMIEHLARDENTAAKALLLHLTLLLHENQLKYPLPIYSSEESDSIDFGMIVETYRSYFSNHANFPSLKLSVEEEKKVLAIIFDAIEEQIALAKKELKKDGALLRKFILLYLQQKMLEWEWGARKRYLEKGIAKLGAKTVSCLQEQKETLITTNDLVNKFEEQDQNAPLPEFCIQDEDFFRSHFFSLYRIIKSGSKAEKGKLRNMIDMSSHLDTPFYTLVKKISHRSWWYPPLWLLNDYQNQYHEKQSDYDNNANWDKQSKKRYKIAVAKNWRDFAIGFITGGETWQVISSNTLRVFYTLRTVCFPSGKFSIGTQLYEQLAQPFKKKFSKKHRTEGRREAVLDCDGKGLKETDRAFDQYFDQLLNHYFEAHEPPAADNDVRLPTSHPDKNVEKKLLQEQEELDHYLEGRPNVQTTYELNDGLKLEDLRDELEGKAHTLATRLKVQKAALLWQLNDIPKETERRNRKHIQKIGFRKQLTWDDLRELTLKGDVESFREKTHLSEKEIKRLLVGTSDYLITSTRVEQMNRILTTLQKAQSGEDRGKRKLLLQNVAKSLKIVRAYDPAPENVSEQWFEHASRYHYRQNQLEKLEEVTNAEHDEILAEMPTGFGKTKTLIPSADFKKGLEGRLVVNVWPSSLEMQNAVDMREQMDKSYGRKVDRFTFDRTSAFSTKSLEHLYEELKKDQKEGRPINLRSESLRALELHALLILDRASGETEDMAELKVQIGYFLKILRLIRTEGWSTIDESHVVLNPKDKLIYAIGNPEILSSKQVEIFEEFFDVLSEGKLDELLQITENQQNFSSEDDYDGVIAPCLAKHFAEKFHIDEENRESFENFVLNKDSDVPEWIQESVREQIALVKGMLAHVLKTALKGSVDENFGLSKLHIKSKEYAISYSSANTPKETKTSPSQFKNLHETMCKTYITYLHKGLTADQFKKLFAFLKEEALKEAENNVHLDRTQASEFYRTICPGLRKPLTTLNDKDIEELFVNTDLRRNKTALFYYIRNIVVPQLKHYPTSLISTVHNFRSQFACSTSLSATPQDTSTHGPDTVFIPMRGTSGQVTHLLLTKCSDPKTIHEIQSTKAADALEETIDSVVKKNPKIHAMIDIGAQFKGLSNYQVASKLRGKFQDDRDIEAVLFFDENAGLFKIMDIASGQIHDPLEANIDPDIAHTFFDQNRCFGSDVKQGEDAVGLMTVGKDTTKAAAGQGAGRMRLWHNGQSVEVAYPAVLKEEIFGDQTPSISQLLVYWTANQQKQEAEKNYQSQLEQMDNEIRRVLLDSILGIALEKASKANAKEPNVDRAIELLKQFRSEFFSYDSLDPWEMYAAIPPDEDTVECLRNYREEYLKKVRKLKGLNIRERAFISERLEKYLEKWEGMNLPVTVKAGSGTLGMECEVLQEVEVEMEVQAYIAEEVSKREPSVWPEQLDLFKPGWEKPRKEYIALKKLTNAINNFPPLKAAKKFLATGPGALIGCLLSQTLCIVPVALPTIWAIGSFIAGAALGAYTAELHFNILSFCISKKNAVYRVKDLMSLYLPEKLQKTSKIFSPNFIVSNNYYAQKTQKVAEAAQRPFDVEQKPLYSVLVIMDEMENGSRNFKVMAIDQNDSAFFHRKLKEDRETTTGEQAAMRTRKVGIYDLSNEIFTVQGTNKFAAEDLGDPAFGQLIGEAKFLNGDVDYNERELDHFGSHLQRVAKDAGYNVVQSLFCDHILQFHPVNRKLINNKGNPKPIARLLGLAH
ncbi:MAG: DUF3638 domain-containing protein [Waddliaceae bacterium]